MTSEALQGLTTIVVLLAIGLRFVIWAHRQNKPTHAASEEQPKRTTQSLVVLAERIRGATPEERAEVAGALQGTHIFVDLLLSQVPADPRPNIGVGPDGEEESYTVSAYCNKENVTPDNRIPVTIRVDAARYAEAWSIPMGVPFIVLAQIAHATTEPAFVLDRVEHISLD